MRDVDLKKEEFVDILRVVYDTDKINKFIGNKSVQLHNFT